MAKKEIKKEKATEVKSNTLKQRISNIIGWFKEKPFRWIGVLVLIAIIVFVVVNSLNKRANANQQYQTATIQRGDLIAIVGATGIVEARQTVDLNWQTTGRVEHVFFGTNDQVKNGDILADLADNSLPQSVILANADLVSAKKDLNDLVNSTTESAQQASFYP